MGTEAIDWLEPKEFSFHSAADAAADGTAADLASKYTALLLEVTITGVATVTPKAKIESDDYVNIPAINFNSAVEALTITASGLYLVNVVGVKTFIADLTSRDSGTVTVIGRAVAIPLPMGRFSLVGSLPAFSAIPAVKIDQTTPGTTNLVQVGGTLPAFTAIPAVKIDQTTPGTTNLVQVGGTLPAFAATPDVNIEGSDTLLQGVKTVTTATTREALGGDVSCREVLVSALHSNTGYVYVGNASVSSSAYGRRLRPEESVRISVSNLNLVYLDVSVSGEGVSYLGVV